MKTVRATAFAKEPERVGAPIRFPFLDVLRGVSILMVYSFHALGGATGTSELRWNRWFRDFGDSSIPATLLPFSLGWTGVAVFFVVSGFCIHVSHTRTADATWSRFFRRRFFRIYPPYFVALVLFGVLWPLAKVLFDTSGDSSMRWGQVLAHAFLVHNFDHRTFFAINPAFWSIAVEAQLYLLYPVVLMLKNRFGWNTTLVVVGSIEISLRLAMAVVTALSPETELPRWLTDSPLSFWMSWTIGAVVAERLVSVTPRSLSAWPVWPWAIAFAASCLFRPLASFGFLFAAMTTASLVMRFGDRGDLPITSNAGAAVWKGLRFVGVVSFSMYLLHQPILMIVSRVFLKFPALSAEGRFVFLVALLPVAILIAWVFFRWIERPSAEFGGHATAGDAAACVGRSLRKPA